MIGNFREEIAGLPVLLAVIRKPTVEYMLYSLHISNANLAKRYNAPSNS